MALIMPPSDHDGEAAQHEPLNQHFFFSDVRKTFRMLARPSSTAPQLSISRVRITAPGGLQRAKERSFYAKLIPYSDLSELGTLSPGKCLEVAHLLVLKTVRRRD